LKISKRFEKNEKFIQIKKLIDNFKGDLNDEKILIRHIIYKYFKNNLIKDINQLQTDVCLTYYNDTRDFLNEHIHKKLHGDKKYFVGLELICKDYIKYEKSKIKLYRNMLYKIEKIENDIIYLNVDDNILPFNINTITNKFTLPHCITGFSCQGLTISKKYTIFDIFCKHVDLKYFYVVLTRNIDLNNVYFFVGSIKKYVDELNENKLKSKIQNYKIQDKNADRIFNEEDYIDVETIKKIYDNQKGLCNFCHENVELYKDNSNKMILDRISNDKPHLKDNCVISCSHCNCVRGNRI